MTIPSLQCTNCACAVTDGVQYARAYYNRTTSKVLPTPLLQWKI